MAYRRSSGRARSSNRFSPRTRAAASRGSSRGRSSYGRGGGGRQQTVRLVIQSGPPAGAQALPGLAGVAVGRDGLQAMTPNNVPGRARF